MNRPLVLTGLIVLLLANIVSILELQFLWIIPLLTFILLPGYGLLFKLGGAAVRKNGLISFVLAFTLGLALFYPLGIALNSLQYVGLDAPLSAIYILPLLNAVSLLSIITISHRLRGYTFNFKWSLSKRSVLLIAYMLATLLVNILGITLLNNHGSNYLVIIGVTMLCLMPFLAGYALKSIKSPTIAVILFLSSLSLLLQLSLRSNYLLGSDILNEAYVFDLVSQSSFYNMFIVNHTYNACLSITLLPQFVKELTNVDSLFVYKVVFQVLFSVVPVIVFLIARMYTSTRFAFIGSLAFLTFSNFIGSMPNHMRQEIAVLFFAAFILVMLLKGVNVFMRKSLLLIFGAAMIVSHYSTSYVALLLLLMYYLAKLWIGHKKKDYGAESPGVSGTILLTLILFAILWYSIIAPTSGGVLNYIRNSVSNLSSTEKENHQAPGASILDQFNIFARTETSTSDQFKEFIVEENVQNPDYNPLLVPQEVTAGISDSPATQNILSLFIEFIKKTYKLFLGISLVAYLFVRKMRPVNHDNTILALLWGCLLVVMMSFVIPSFSVEYDQERFIQQLLVILAVPFAVLAGKLFKARLSFVAITLFFAFYTAMSTGLLDLAAGGRPLSVRYSNIGTDYGRYYISRNDVEAAEWLNRNRGFAHVHSDQYGANRLRYVTGSLDPDERLLPGDYVEGSLVYYYSANENGYTFRRYKGRLLIFTPPETHLRQNSNKVYSNGKASVFKND